MDKQNYCGQVTYAHMEGLKLFCSQTLNLLHGREGRAHAIKVGNIGRSSFLFVSIFSVK
jgi:hypothetical protein